MASAKVGTSSLTGKQVKVSRLPQAPASLLVQLPPNELKKFQSASTSGGNGQLVDEGEGAVEASDLHLLATSIQQRREREARVFAWQQRLIDADERLSRSDLKRAVSDAASHSVVRLKLTSFSLLADAAISIILAAGATREASGQSMHIPDLLEKANEATPVFARHCPASGCSSIQNLSIEVHNQAR